MDTTNLDEMIRLFGTRANLAKKLGINPQAVYQWKDKVPPLRALQLQIIVAKAILLSQSVENGLNVDRESIE